VACRLPTKRKEGTRRKQTTEVVFSLIKANYLRRYSIKIGIWEDNMKMKIGIIIAFLLLSVLFPVAAYAACTGSSPNWTCDTDNTTVAQIQSCINNASPEDTITFDAGSVTWSTGIKIDKGINLIGAGVGKTVITWTGSSSATMIDYEPAQEYISANYNFRISGFDFIATNNGKFIMLPQGYSTPQTNIRIDNNEFNNSSTGGAVVWLSMGGGVIDNNVINNCAYPFRAMGGVNETDAFKVLGEYSPGSELTVMYIEDNYINGLTGFVTDGDEGSSYVFRYNTVDTSKMTSGAYGLFDMHVGTRGAEVYGNLFEGGHSMKIMKQRGGRAVEFYNSFDMTYSSDTAAQLYNQVGCPALEIMTHNHSYYWSNLYTSGTNAGKAFVSGDNCATWPIRESEDFFDDDETDGYPNDVKCGTLGKRPSTCSEGDAYWATDESCTDLTGMVGANPATPISGTLYICSSANTWTPYYTPYTYPHPLRKGVLIKKSYSDPDEEILAPPTNLKLID
jgi:hypothetical protein